MSICRLLIPSALTLGCITPAWGQTGSPLDEGRVDREQPVIAPQPGDADPEGAPSAATRVDIDDESAPAIKSIQFVGTDVPLVVGEAAQDFIGEAASRNSLQALTQAMSEAYGRSDVALFTIVVPQQDLSSGNLKVLVAEGFIQNVVLEGEVEGRRLDLVRSYAHKLTLERPTSRRRLERYLSLIRDIPGLKVKSRLETGKGRGAVRLVLTLDYDRPRVSLGFDNRTTRLIDGGQFEARALAYSTLREGDRTEITGTASVDFEDLLFLRLSHSTPIGQEGARLALSYGHLETKPAGTSISGNADAFGLTFSYPVIRSYKRNLTASIALDGVNSDNTAFGSIIASEKSRAVRAAIGYSISSKRRAFGGGLTLSHGLDVLGAEIANGLGEKTFVKVNVQANLTQAIGRSVFLRLNTSGQWSDDPLPAVERFSVGGEKFGRAFEKGLINADRGIAGLAEVAIRPLRKGPFRTSEIYSFVDYAFVGLLDRPMINGRNFRLGSAGAGIRAAYGEDFMLGLEAANTIDRPYANYASEWRFSIVWRLSIRP